MFTFALCLFGVALALCVAPVLAKLSCMALIEFADYIPEPPSSGSSSANYTSKNSPEEAERSNRNMQITCVIAGTILSVLFTLFNCYHHAYFNALLSIVFAGMLPTLLITCVVALFIGCVWLAYLAAKTFADPWKKIDNLYFNLKKRIVGHKQLNSIGPADSRSL
jgi:hypothetical protein